MCNFYGILCKHFRSVFLVSPLMVNYGWEVVQHRRRYSSCARCRCILTVRTMMECSLKRLKAIFTTNPQMVKKDSLFHLKTLLIPPENVEEERDTSSPENPPLGESPINSSSASNINFPQANIRDKNRHVWATHKRNTSQRTSATNNVRTAKGPHRLQTPTMPRRVKKKINEVLSLKPQGSSEGQGQFLGHQVSEIVP